MLKKLSTCYQFVLIAFLSLTVFTSPADAELKIFRVDGIDGSETGNGSAWGEDAFLYLRPAIVAAKAWVDTANPPNTAQIWVRGATEDGIKYKPHLPLDGLPDRKDTFKLHANVKIYGGFTTTHTQLSDRDPATYITILDGLFYVGTTPYASFSVVEGVNADSTTANCLLDGFVIQNGLSNSDANIPLSSGAGIFIGNGADPRIDRCTIQSNSAYRAGGGAYVSAGCSPVFTRCTFSGNSAPQASFFPFGGGIAAEGEGTLSLINCKILQNFVADAGSIVANGGGGVAVGGEDRHLLMVNCVVAENAVGEGCEGPNCPIANGRGGGIFVFGTYTSSSEPGATADIINSTIANNTAKGGGGIAIYNTCNINSCEVITRLRNSIVWNNSAWSGGTNGDEILIAGGRIQADYSNVNHTDHQADSVEWLTDSLNQQTNLGDVAQDNPLLDSEDYSIACGSPSQNKGTLTRMSSRQINMT